MRTCIAQVCCSCPLVVLLVHDMSLQLGVEVARDSAPGVCVEGVQSDPARRGVGEFTGGKERAPQV